MTVEKTAGESEAWCDGLKTFVDHHVLSVPDLRHWCYCPLCPEATSDCDCVECAGVDGANDKDDEGNEGDEEDHCVRDELPNDGPIAFYVL